MLPNANQDPHGSWGARQDYLALPYNSPIRRYMRGIEGGTYIDVDTGGGGWFSGLGAVVGGVFGAIVAGPGGVVGGMIFGGGAGAGAGAAAGGGIGAGAGAVSAVGSGAAMGAIYGAGAGAAWDLLGSWRIMRVKEWALAKQVFESSLGSPGDGDAVARSKILLTDFVGPTGRAFTYPASSIAAIGAVVSPVILGWLIANPRLFKSGTIFVNLGLSMDRDFDQYADPRVYKTKGQLLIHELTHAWQIRNGSTPGFICAGLDVQARDALGEDVYSGSAGKQWNEYGLEQQATLVDKWYGRGALQMAFDPAYRYIEYNIRPGTPDAHSPSAAEKLSKGLSKSAAAFKP